MFIGTLIVGIVDCWMLVVPLIARSAIAASRSRVLRIRRAGSCLVSLIPDFGSTRGAFVDHPGVFDVLEGFFGVGRLRTPSIARNAV
jgi:hypothetical protein